MKLLVLAAFIAVVSSGPLSEQQVNQQQWPWQSGKLYRYDVNSHTLARLWEGASSGNAFKAQFIVRVKSPGYLQAKLENPQLAQFHEQLPNNMALPSDLKYEPVKNIDKPFEITVEGGRVLSLSLPSDLSVAHENLLKGLISTLQVDLSAYHVQQPSNFDKEHQQGLFQKMEVDVTGDCETLYSVSPVSADWRRELPQFASHEDPMEITKSKNYGHCHHRVAYHFGVPQDAEWTGTAHKENEKQFISHSAVSRILAGEQGPIYKAETTSSVHAHPHLYGNQKAEVHSFVRLNLVAFEQDSANEWPQPEANRPVRTLLYAMSTKQVAIHDQSSSSSESSSHEHINMQPMESLKRAPRSVRSDSLSASSSSDSSSAYINDAVPNMNEPAYAALYMSSQSRGDKKQNTMNVQKLLQDLAQQLQNPDNMPKGDFLSKFNILVRIIASMSTNQLAQTSRNIEIGQSSNNNVKADMWMIYRDAVVQAGTPPAFQQIKTWIKNKRIVMEEAAQVISALAGTLRYPTREIMTQFFDLSMSNEVQQDQILSTAAVIAATKFINLGQVNNITAHAYYPTHMYGRLARKHDTFVLDNILPRLSQELKKAIEQQDSSKAQVYIKAIGNLGHPEILKVFAPYMEGNPQVSTYLRSQIVSQLRVLAEQENKNVRAVLYSILKNTAEPYEVRVAAILNIFAAHPTTDMMQVMAQMTNDDHSIQVRAALKNGIETAASLKDPRYRHLTKSAQAVREIVTSEDLGKLASAKYFVDNNKSEEQNAYFREMSFIGSDSSTISKYSRINWRSKFNGWPTGNAVSASFSDVQEVLDYIKQMFYKPRKSDAEQKYSAQKISQMFNIHRDQETPLEAAFSYEYNRVQRFFSYGENEFKQLVTDILQYMTQLEQGIEKHYTRVLNADEVSVMFPIASGMPFIYKYKQPVVIHLQAKASGNINRNPTNLNEMSSNVQNEIQMTLASNIDGSVSFMDTLNDQLASAGVVQKNQLNLAWKMSVQQKANDVKIKIEPQRPDQDVTIAHYSVWPYTANQKRDSLVTISQDRTTKLVERPRKIAQTDVKIGQQVGMVVQLNGYSQSSDFKNSANPLQILSKLFYLTDPTDLALTHFNLRYLGKQSENKAATVTINYDEFYNLQQNGKMGQTENIQDVSPNSRARREEMANRVSSGINSPKVQVVDSSVTFEGPQKQEYTFTVAVGNSPVDSKIQAALFAGRNSVQHGNDQINAVVKVNQPEISYLNYLQALNRELKMTYSADIKFGQNGNIQIQGSSERSKTYMEQLKNSAMGNQCEQQASSNNQYQPACHRQLVKAHAPDQFKTTVTYKGVSSQFMNWVNQGYRMLKQQLRQRLDENIMEKSGAGKLQLEVDASYIDNYLRFKMITPQGAISNENIAIPVETPYVLSMYTPFSLTERFGNSQTNGQYQPYCTVDGSKVKTFANRSYDYQLSQSWHVVMQDESNNRGQWEDLVILARRPSQQQQEIYISYKTETGKDLEIEIQSAQPNSRPNVAVRGNGKKISEGDLTIYWDDNTDSPLLQYYTNTDGVLTLNIRDGRLRLMTDGQRVVVTSQQHRKTNRGICGQNSGESRDDYETPNGLVDQPQYYGASFALDDQSDPKTQQLKNEAKQQAYQSQPKYTMILRSDNVWQQAAQREKREWNSQNIYRTKSYLRPRGACKLEQQVQYRQNQAEICITTSSLDACPSHCQGQDYEVRAAQVICQSSTDQQFQTYRNEIQRGQNPQVSGVPRVEHFRVPSSCRA